MIRFEYCTIEIAHFQNYEHQLSNDELEKLGDEGWELVGILRSGDVVIGYFKRPK